MIKEVHAVHVLCKTKKESAIQLFLARQIALEGEIYRNGRWPIEIPASSVAKFKEMSPSRWLKTSQPFERNSG
jgi:hypothetical protein